MKVAICGFGERGGMFHYPVQLANGLSNYTSVTLLLPEEGVQSDYIADEVDTIGYSNPSTTNAIKDVIKGMRIHSDIHKELKNVNPDIVHHSFIGPTKPTLFLPLLRMEQGNLVATLHDPMLKNGNQIEKEFYSIKNRIATKVTDCTIVHGEATKKQANQAGYDTEKLAIIPHGKYDFFKHIGFDQKEMEENTLLFFGSLRFDKGSDRILKILDEIQPSIPDITAIVAGNPVDVEPGFLRELEEDDRVELHAEYIPDTKVGELFSRSSLVVLPYREATSSGVLMTAYAFEKPVVATDVGDIGALINEDNIGLKTKNDAESIGKGVSKILSNAEVYKKKEKNMAFNSKKYSWESIAEDTVSLYQSILNKPDQSMGV